MSGQAYERLIAALEATVKVSQHRDGSARAQCPGHDSRGLTLSIARTDNGVAVHCFGGCETVDVLAAVGLGMRDLYDDNWQRPAAWTPRPEPSPIGDPDHFCDRILQQERLEADPAWQARRATELADAVAHRHGDCMGVGHE